MDLPEPAGVRRYSRALMAKRSRASRTDRSSHPPLWLVEGLDIVDRRRGMLLAVVGGVIVVGAVLAVVLPGVVPPTAAVGAAIGLAALLLGVAAAVAADATDLIVRGPRHVAAAGGELVAVLPREPDVVSAGPLAEAIVEVREPGTPLLLGLAAAGRDARRSALWTDVIARALVGSGVSVLRADLASGRSDGPGLLEVVREGERLARVVELEPGVRLARLAAGRDHAAALSALTELPGKLPQDLDVLLVALPSATSRGVVAAAGALDHVLVVAERDRTSRVDLIAGLDALEAAGTQAQVVLLDTVTAMRLAPPVEVAEDETGERRRGLASTVGRSPVVPAGAAAGGAAGVAAADEDDAADPDADLPADAADEDDEVADDGLAEQRDVEVLDAAAEATALAMTEAEDEPLPERLEGLPDAPAPDGEPAAPAEDLAGGPEDPAAPDDQASDLDAGGYDERYGALDADARGEESPSADAVVDLAPEQQEEQEEEATDQPDRWRDGAALDDVGGDDPGDADHDLAEVDDVGGDDDLAEVDDVGGDDPGDADHDLADVTDRLPPVGSDADGPGTGRGPATDRGLDTSSASDEDLLRTTAQLAILADDLALRSTPEPEPHHGRPHQHGRPHLSDGADARESGGPDEDHT